MAESFRVAGRRPWITALLVAVSLVGLYLIDRDLARIERNELAAQANRYFSQAQRDASEKRYDAAIPLYRRALILERGSPIYRIALGKALMSADQPKEATTVLATVLNEDSNNGEANLQMARLLRQANDPAGAAAYYHRAIYGSWPSGSGNQGLHVRLELAQMLADQGRERELLAELLLIEDDTREMPEVQLRVARWYQRAGFLERAASVFRRILDADAVAGAAYEGLGDAELAMGNYRSAQNAYMAALRRGQNDVSDRLIAAVELTQLDPTIRRLTAGERLQRSERVLTRVLGVTARCPVVAESQKRAREELAKEKRRRSVDYERFLSIAEEIWRTSRQSCPAVIEADTTLTAVLNRLAQQP
jgi:tetratricopeptide (TPR) repeat protein